MAGGTEQRTIDYIQLINTENIGPKTFSALLSKFGTAAEALKNLPSKYKPFSRTEAEKELKLAHHLGITVLTKEDNDYPKPLLEIDDAPPVLYVKGHPEILNHSCCLAIVGSRNASVNGRKFTSRLAYELTETGVMIVSGMARGIDTSAHKGALYANDRQGSTIAVLGTGVDVPYPAENKELYEQISMRGCIVSELPLGTTPQAANFPRRNRIISGISHATLVTEANIHSGSLITAYTAAEQGRDVMAVPGFPADGRSGGTNKLIKEGAALVENTDDIINIMHHCGQWQTAKLNRCPEPELFTTPLDNEGKTDNIPPQNTKSGSIMDFLTPDGIDINEIIDASGLDSATVAAQLLELELEGRIERQPGNKVALLIR